MIFRYDIEQGTEEWLRLKWGKIGGSTSKGLFVKSDTLLFDLVSQVTEEYTYEESYTSSAMDRGNILEPEAKEALSNYTGLEFINVGWIQSESHPLLGISPDGLTANEEVFCEIKCPGAKKHIETCLKNEIPLEHLHQLVHYFTVVETCKVVWFCSYRPESIKPIFVKLLTRESVVNLGTKAEPVLKSVQEWVDIAKNEAVKLQEQIDECIIKLNF